MLRKNMREIGLSCFCFVLAGMVWWSASQIPPSHLGKSGAGLVPQSVAIILAALAALHMLKHLFLVPEDREDLDKQDIHSHEPVKWKIAAIALCLGSMIGLLEFGIAGFTISSVLFVFISVLLLSDFSWRSAALALVIAVSFAGLTVLIFTKLFTVILP